MAKSNALVGNLANTTGVSSTAQLTGFIQAQNFNGGTGATSSTYLRGDGTWATVSGTINTLTTNRLLYYSGSGTSTTLSSLSYTAPKLPVTNSSGELVLQDPSASFGGFLIGSSSGAPAFNLLTGLQGITTAFNGSTLFITISGKPDTTTVTTTSQAMSWGSMYIVNNSSRVTLTLPTSAPLGSVLRIVSIGTGGWTIAQNSGQSIRVSSTSVSTVGTGGSVSSNGAKDSIFLICTVANTTWKALIKPLSSGLVVV